MSRVLASCTVSPLRVEVRSKINILEIRCPERLVNWLERRCAGVAAWWWTRSHELLAPRCQRDRTRSTDPITCRLLTELSWRTSSEKGDTRNTPLQSIQIAGTSQLISFKHFYLSFFATHKSGHRLNPVTLTTLFIIPKCFAKSCVVAFIAGDMCFVLLILTYK